MPDEAKPEEQPPKPPGPQKPADATPKLDLSKLKSSDLSTPRKNITDVFDRQRHEVLLDAYRKIAVEVHKVLARPGARERFRDMRARWKLPVADSPGQFTLRDDRISIEDKYVWLGTIHDYCLPGEAVFPADDTNKVTETTPILAWLFPSTPRDGEDGEARLTAFLADVEADLAAAGSDTKATFEDRRTWLGRCAKAGAPGLWNFANTIMGDFIDCASVRLWPYTWVNTEKPPARQLPGTSRLVAQNGPPTEEQKKQGLRFKKMPSDKAAALIYPQVDVSDNGFQDATDAVAQFCRRPDISVDPTPFIDLHALCIRPDLLNLPPAEQAQLNLVRDRVFALHREITAKLGHREDEHDGLGPLMRSVLEMEQQTRSATEESRPGDKEGKGGSRTMPKKPNPDAEMLREIANALEKFESIDPDKDPDGVHQAGLEVLELGRKHLPRIVELRDTVYCPPGAGECIKWLDLTVPSLDRAKEHKENFAVSWWSVAGIQPRHAKPFSEQMRAWAKEIEDEAAKPEAVERQRIPKPEERPPVQLKDRFTLAPGQVLFDRVDLMMPTGLTQEVFAMLHGSFGVAVSYMQLHKESTPSGASEELRKAVVAINKRFKTHGVPCRVEAKMRESYVLAATPKPPPAKHTRVTR